MMFAVSKRDDLQSFFLPLIVFFFIFVQHHEDIFNYFWCCKLEKRICVEASMGATGVELGVAGVGFGAAGVGLSFPAWGSEYIPASQGL